VNVVIYTTDFEPITVIDLPRTVLDKIEQTGGVRLALGSDKDESGNTITPQMCTITLVKLRWFNGEEKPILVTKDEELALLLKPDWLPGQRGLYNLLYNHIKNLTKQLINRNDSA